MAATPDYTKVSERVKGFDGKSYTLGEFLIEEGLVQESTDQSGMDLRTPLARYQKGEESRFSMNIPVMSASMQAVTGSEMGIALSMLGGIGPIFCSQPIDRQAEMVRRVKHHKAGFVESESNLKPSDTLEAAIELTDKMGHSTIAITSDGSPHGELLGLITRNDYLRDDGICDPKKPVRDYMTPFDKLVVGTDGISLEDANRLMYERKTGKLPIVDSDNNLRSIVFRRDWEINKAFPNQLVDDKKRLIAAAALNTMDYEERAPALVDAGVDVVYFDSSSGFSEYQKKAALWVRDQYPDLIIGGGNITNARAFKFLAEEANLDFIKIGIGGGSICITRQQTNLGKGQGTAVIEVAEARDAYFHETGTYIPLVSDGSISSDGQINAALCLGANTVQMGRYFAMCNESPPQITVSSNNVRTKGYWGEGSPRARNWQRYDHGNEDLSFDEGVEGYLPVSGPVREVLGLTLMKVRDGMKKFGCRTIAELHQKSQLQIVSGPTIEESGSHDIMTLDTSGYRSDQWGGRDN